VTFVLANRLARAKCAVTLEAHRERVDHFAGRVPARGLDQKHVVIVVINVDSEGGAGADLVRVLFPRVSWQEIRDRGEVPFARGLAFRDSIQDIVSKHDLEAGGKLREHDGLPVLVVDHGAMEVFDA
jgi:hypothetical protein